MSIIDLVKAEGDELRLESVAKDFSPLWPVTVESLDRDTIIGSSVSRFLLSDQSSTKVLKMVCRSLSVTATFSRIPFNGERPRRL